MLVSQREYRSKNKVSRVGDDAWREPPHSKCVWLALLHGSLAAYPWRKREAAMVCGTSRKLSGEKIIILILQSYSR